MNSILAAAALLLVPAYLSPAAETSAPLTSTEQIQQIIAHQLDSWNRNDAAAWASDYSTLATFINVRGDVVKGREAIEKIHAFIFQGPYKGTRLSASIDTIEYPAPHVAIADITSEVSGFATLPPGLTPTEPGIFRTRLKYILVEEAGTWRIAAAQNTAVSPTRMDVK
ncbi:SgcJ/EcaC family oxidoreductase [Terriglobus roseus]|uniref:DUF4440 domain-containing protein n=1 Tax=Terriglobus roseus TaxID=392734 RepID=A0A1G7EZ46_9BACT|nr:SgcJ/EcaC family oxidoreductase [Terriglobus roseus]SDE68867.1 conserved hypothetical protein [Terriglobus roseus]